MSEFINISPVTKNVIDFLKNVPVGSYRERRTFHLQGYQRGSFVNLDLLREELLNIEERISMIGPIGNPPFAGETISDWLWLLYEEDVNIIPIYDDGVAITRWKPIVHPSAIPNILSFLVVEKSIGVDIETHGFGYHFHFGEIKRDKLIRSNLLFTFNPTDNETCMYKVYPLYAENHGGGWKKDISTIGVNKRRPIYNVCESEMRKRGLENFRKPSAKANVFYPEH